MPEKDDASPMTLASLRGRGSRVGPGRGGAKTDGDRPQEKTAPQMGLFAAETGGEAERPGEGAPSMVATPHPMPPRLISGRPPAPTPNGRAAAALERAGTERAGARAEAATPEMTSPWGGLEQGGERRDARAVPEKRVWTVRGLVADVRGRVEGGYGEVWVEGEISNCRPAASGHLYLTLKEGEAQLPVVLFRRQAQLLRFRPNAGMAVLVRGRLSVYEGRGELQLIGEVVEPRGAGALLLAFEQLKARLAAEGLFEASRKRPLPAFPKCVGVITSTGGAVLHDIVTVVRRRHGRLNLLVYPAVVQGPGCAASVIAGLRWFNRNPGKAELIVVARGGGAPEDLAGFNDEALARAIAGSTPPVISAVGHETDFTIADFVADLRAPTPSAAAEIMTQSQHRIEERLASLEGSLKRASRYRILEARQRFARTSADHVLRRVQQGIDRRQQRLDDAERRMLRSLEQAQAVRRRRLEVLSGRLERQNVATRLIWGRDRLARMEDRLQGVTLRGAVRRSNLLDRVAARLEALSPLAVLARGYALVYNVEGTAGETGGLITSSTETGPGRRIRARLAQGSLIAEVTGTEQG